MQRFVKKMQQYVSFTTFLILFVGLTAVLSFVLILSDVKGESYDIREFTLSPDTIRSNKTVEDPVKTEEERTRVASEVQPVYQFTEEIGSNRAAIVSSIFDYVLDVKANSVIQNTQEDGIPAETVKPMSAMVDDLRSKLSPIEKSETAFRLSDEQLRVLLGQNSETLREVRDILTNTTKTVMKDPIRNDDLIRAKNELERILREDQRIPTSLMQVAVTIGRFSIVENEILNEEITEARVKDAMADVEPTKILQGQVIVREGQVVDREVYRQLELTGMLTSQTTYKPIVGLAFYIILMMFLVFTHFYSWKATAERKGKILLVFLIIFLLNVVVMKLIGLVEKDYDVMVAFLFPTALSAMLTRALSNEKLAFLMCILTAGTSGLVLRDGYTTILQMEISLYVLFSGIVAVYMMSTSHKRSVLLQTSMLVALTNLIFLAFYLLMTQSSYSWQELTFYGIAAVVSGLLSGALAIGLLPFFETVFNILSDMKLIELSNPNHPLLKKILTETPGTYHHSVMVANLADSACEAIGANGLLARVGSYYHDIGKTKRPSFFIENQMNGKNPHDTIPPETSSDIIIAHTTEGAKMLSKHKMPQEIIDIARQHHGTSLLQYFYVKAKEQNDEVAETDYRYPGPKPQTKEAAVISVADSVEAAVRSMKEPSAEKIRQVVNNIIKGKLNDGQFNECDLSMKELKKVESVICETMNGIYHSRIEYPK
ncbi:HD family phosphohydrolase [Chungangia koreensis]|uniref:HD family phosphohydrolase n=1 Tax=Chungangia koreensis TaxID=752657 RepID=A0ABV8X570_9LACT